MSTHFFSHNTANGRATACGRFFADNVPLGRGIAIARSDADVSCQGCLGSDDLKKARAARSDPQADAISALKNWNG